MKRNTYYKPMSLHKKLNSALAFFGVILSVVLLFFISQMVSNFAQSTESLSFQVSNTVISSLEDSFLMLEQAAVSLSADDDVKMLLESDDPLDFHDKAQAVRQTLDKIYIDDGLVDDVLIYTEDGVYSRLRGEIGNTSANRVFSLIQTSLQERHMTMKLENETYIAYVSKIEYSEQVNGYLVFLMKNTDVARLFSDLAYSDTLEIALVVDDSIIVSTNSQYNGITVQQLEKELDTYAALQVGFTPYQLVVSDQSVFQSLLPNIVAMTLIVLAVFAAVLIFAYHFFQKIFFAPMIEIINSTEKLRKTNEQISKTGQYEFDELIEQINSMVIRITKNSQELFSMQNKMQAAEIEKQQIFIVSLKKQINAHFTVNTLSVIRRLIDINESKKARLMCDGLSAMLGYAHNAEELISCVDEFILLEQYVEIMQIRYKDRIEAEFDLPDELFDMQIPRMLLQPIVENAIVHGVLSAKGKKLEVWLKKEGDLFRFSIKDDGKGMTEQKLAGLRKQISESALRYDDIYGLENIALLNIQKRIQSMFGGEYGLTINSYPGQGTLVEVVIPCIDEKDQM